MMHSHCSRQHLRQHHWHVAALHNGSSSSSSYRLLHRPLQPTSFDHVAGRPRCFHQCGSLSACSRNAARRRTSCCRSATLEPPPLPPPTVFEPHVDPAIIWGQLAVLSLTVGAAAYWWYVVVPSARRTLAKEKRTGALKDYLETLQSTPSQRRLERWFYTDWLRQLKRRQELVRSAAAKLRAPDAAAGSGVGIVSSSGASSGSGVGAGFGGGREAGGAAGPRSGVNPVFEPEGDDERSGLAQVEESDREPAFFSLDNPLIATAALVGSFGAVSALVRAVSTGAGAGQ